MKKVKLTYKPDYNFVLIGISSHENDYKLAWSINNTLNLNFSKKDDLTIYDKKHSVSLPFSVFSHNDETNLLSYNLISNRCENGFLIKEINNFDFFIQIYGDLSDKEVTEILNKLKKDSNIILATKLDLSKIKSIGNLIF